MSLSNLSQSSSDMPGRRPVRRRRPAGHLCFAAARITKTLGRPRTGRSVKGARKRLAIVVALMAKRLGPLPHRASPSAGVRCGALEGLRHTGRSSPCREAPANARVGRPAFPPVGPQGFQRAPYLEDASVDLVGGLGGKRPGASLTAA